MDFLSDSNELAAVDVMNFVREAVQRYDNLKPLIVEKLLEAFPQIRNIKIIRSVLWILGEYCDTNDSILDFMVELRKSIGEVPIVASEIRKAAGEEGDEADIEGDSPKPKSSGPKVTADGTYITQSALITRLDAYIFYYGNLISIFVLLPCLSIRTQLPWFFRQT